MASLAGNDDLKSPPLFCTGAGVVPVGDPAVLTPWFPAQPAQAHVSRFLITSPASSSSLYIHEAAGTGINKS